MKFLLIFLFSAFLLSFYELEYNDANAVGKPGEKQSAPNLCYTIKCRLTRSALIIFCRVHIVRSSFSMTQIIDQTSSHRTVGKSTRRADGLEKVTGRTRYAGDMPAIGLLHARLVLSPYAHARIVSIDSSAALAVPGVRFVYTSETLGIV